jgi:hypothetical protein
LEENGLVRKPAARLTGDGQVAIVVDDEDPRSCPGRLEREAHG